MKLNLLPLGYGKFLVFGIFCMLLGFSIGIFAFEEKKMVVVPIDEAQFDSINPAQPNGAQMAILWGNPSVEASTMLLKMKKGGGRLHYHTSDYHLVLLQGSMKHLGKDEKESDAQQLEAGSYWFQPGSEPHVDICLTEECLMFIKWEGKRDGFLAEGQ